MVTKENKGQDGRAPLIGQDGRRKENNYMVYLSTFVAVCGSFSFGTGVGYSSPSEAGIKKDLNLTIAQYSLFGSILTFGAMIGAVASGPMADFFGRKGAMRISSIFCIGGWLAIYLAQGPVPLDTGRLATGYGMGVFSYVVPVFIAEIAPKQLRGLLTAANQLLIIAGVSVSFVIGTLLHWRTMALAGLIPCVVLLVGLSLIPESPRWLAKIGKQAEFDFALRKLRGTDVDVSEEAAEIKDYIETLDKLPKARLFDLFQTRYLKSVIIGVGLMIFQQFGGINGICFYASSIFASAGFAADIGTITYAVLQVVVTTLNALFIDKAGRKPLLLVSVTGMALGCLLAAASFYMKTYQIALAAAPALAVTGILLYIAGFSLGMGAVPWVIMSEIFPINIKGTAGGLVTLVNWAGAWAVSYTFNFLLTWSSYGTFLLYAAVNVACIVFVINLVPETKGKTLEEIQAAINHH
ncbi:putative major facilitator, sugar transporter, major facilitator superfamily [Helianthus annuus]|uniref:Major facilitator, sugar transporter, major facilitator superfamily n=2 Tax=Helianthus annuus TaxID=4232 RepID=A0A9K3JSF0_HELAN|nr:sugar transporter ERD6-like 7 [Helianthus annuus]KAF5820500.1 putative major facilitator, sugar transporter, major facilitator superfamily [Helianthus annuus]KAJ0625539.1 putative major facilitator, sugar transporter, major facilitator superfamily [Helianthus annuus]